MNRRELIVAAGSALTALGARASDPDFPNRPIHLLVGFTAGSGTDVVARHLADGLQGVLKQPVVVDNLPGAGSTLAAARAAKSPADGYTVYLADFSHAIAPAIYPALHYETVRDFAGIAPVSRFQFALAVSQRSGIDSVAKLVATGQSAPDKLSFGSSGKGSALQLIGQLFAERVQCRFVHVPYRGGADVLNALLAGDIDFAFFPVPPLVPFAAAGKLRIVAAPGPTRDPLAPQVPTLAEQGIRDLDPSTWNVLLAPNGVPADIVDRLAVAVRQVTTADAFSDAIRPLGARPLNGMSPTETLSYVGSQVRLWGDIAKRSADEAPR